MPPSSSRTAPTSAKRRRELLAGATLSSLRPGQGGDTEDEIMALRKNIGSGAPGVVRRNSDAGYAPPPSRRAPPPSNRPGVSYYDPVPVPSRRSVEDHFVPQNRVWERAPKKPQSPRRRLGVKKNTGKKNIISPWTRRESSEDMWKMSPFGSFGKRKVNSPRRAPKSAMKHLRSPPQSANVMGSHGTIIPHSDSFTYVGPPLELDGIDNRHVTMSDKGHKAPKMVITRDQGVVADIEQPDNGKEELKMAMKNMLGKRKYEEKKKKVEKGVKRTLIITVPITCGVLVILAVIIILILFTVRGSSGCVLVEIQCCELSFCKAACEGLSYEDKKSFCTLNEESCVQVCSGHSPLPDTTKAPKEPDEETTTAWSPP